MSVTNGRDPREHIGYRSTRRGVARVCLTCVRDNQEPGVINDLVGIRLERRDVSEDARCGICGWRLAGPTATA